MSMTTAGTRPVRPHATNMATPLLLLSVIAILLACTTVAAATAEGAAVRVASGVGAQPPLVEPFPLLQGADPTGAPARPLSPDPLVATTWGPATNLTNLQRYEVATPVAWTAFPPSAFSGLESLASGKPHITVAGAGALRLDFGREHAAWFEFSSPDLDAATAAHTVTASISEYNEPWPGKTQPLKAYADGRFRLETNAQLYEGVRYAWIIFTPAAADPTCVPHGTEGNAFSLSCPAASGGIQSVEFAEWGTANGDCEAGFATGGCSFDLRANLTALCKGKADCDVSCLMGTCTVAGVAVHTGDPCPGTPKKLTAKVKCAPGPPPPPAAVTPWHVSGLKIVCMVKPVNYSGTFNSSDSVRTQSAKTHAAQGRGSLVLRALRCAQKPKCMNKQEQKERKKNQSGPRMINAEPLRLGYP